MSPKHELLKTWFRRVWAEEDVAAIHELFPEGPNHGLGDPSRVGPKEFAEFHAAICRLLADIRITIDQFMEDGDWISANCTLDAVCQVDRSKIQIKGNVFAKVFEDKYFVECHNHWDFLGFFSQLGLLPSDALMQGLSGKTIGV